MDFSDVNEQLKLFIQQSNYLASSGNETVHAVIGAYCVYSLDSFADTLGKLSIPLVSTVPAFVTDFSRYTTMSRVTYQAAQTNRGWAYIAKFYNWTQIACVLDVAALQYFPAQLQAFVGKIRSWI